MYSNEFRDAVVKLAKEYDVYNQASTTQELYEKLTECDSQIVHFRVNLARYDAFELQDSGPATFSVELGALRYLPADIHKRPRTEQLEIYENLCCQGASRTKPQTLCISTSKVGGAITQNRTSEKINFCGTSVRFSLMQGGSIVALSEYDCAVYHVVASYYKQGTESISFNALAKSFRKSPRQGDFADLLDSLEYMQEVMLLLDDSAEAEHFGYPTTFTYSDRRYFLPIRIHTLCVNDAISGRSWIELVDAPPLLQYDLKYNQTYDLPADILQTAGRDNHKLYTALANYVARRVATILQRASAARKYRTISVDAAAAALGDAYSATHRNRFAKAISDILDDYCSRGLIKAYDAEKDAHNKITGFIIHKGGTIVES